MTKKIWIATGGTGGHVFPALSVATELESQGFNTIISTDRRVLKMVLKSKPANSKVAIVWAAGVGGKSLFNKLIAMFKLAVTTVFYSVRFLFVRPQCVVSFGGYCSVPIVIAANLFRVPILLHEQNGAIGRANKFILPRVHVLMTSFSDVLDVPKTSKTKIVYTGLPVRADFLKMAGSQFPGNNKIFVTGGSLGATILDDIVPKSIAKLNNKKIFVTHQTRPENVRKLQKFYFQNNIRANVLSFVNDMASAIAEADLIIGRSGASTVIEIQTIGRGAIYVPLHINPDQLANANNVSKIGGAITITRDMFGEKYLTATLKDLFSNPARLKKMAEKSLLKNNATDLIVAEIKKIVKN